MYFMPQATTRVYRVCAPLRPIYRYGITITAVTGTFCLWYFFCYKPLAYTIASYKAITDTVAAQPNIERSISVVKAEYESLKYALSQHNRSWKEKGVEVLLECATQAGVFFVSCDIARHRTQPWHIQDTIALSFCGSYESCVTFFSHLSQAKVLYICKNVSMTLHTPHQYLCSCELNISTTE